MSEQNGSLLGDYYQKLSTETGLPENQLEKVESNSLMGAAYLKTKDPVFLGNPPATPNQEFDPLRSAAATIDLTNAYTEPLANYRDYDVPLSPFADLNDERAKRQWTVEKWAHGLTKAGITFGTAFAENTVGLIAGLGNLAFGENHSFTDNPFGRAMDQINEAAREALPNYYTKAEQEASIVGDGWGSGLLSANFWADKVAGGAAYTVASIASMFVGTGEAALVAKLAGAGKYAKLTGVLNKLDKVDELADGIGIGVRSNKSAAYQAAKLVSTGGDAADVVAQTGKLSRVANRKVGARNLTIATQMSLAESSMESRESTNRFKEERIAEWEQATGLDRSQMDMDTLNAIEASAAAAGNLTFGINLPILMASNAILFRNMFKTGKPIAEAVSGKVTRDAAGTWIEQTAKTGFGKAYAKADRLFGKTASGIVTEGFQEGTQFLASEMSRRYYSDKYQTGVGDMVAAFNYGLAETLGSKEGIENIFIGALIGGGTGTISRMFGADKKFQAEKDANTQKLLTLLNNGGLTKALENLDSTEQLLYTNTLAEAASKGNYMVAERIRDRLILSVTNQFRKLGGLDAAFEQLEDMKGFTEQEFKERWGYDMSKSLKEQTGKTQLELIEEVKTKMENYTKVSENIESIIAERQIPQQVIPRVIDSLFQTPEIKNAKILQDKVFSTYANMLLNRIIDIDSIDTGISDRYEKLVQLIPGLGAFSKEDFEFGIKVGEFTFKDGKVELSRDITQEPEDSTVQNEKGVYEQSKRIKKLQEIRDVINAFNDIGRADLAAEASKIFDELTVLMADRTVVNTALKRMNASPNEIAAMLEEELLQQYADSISGEIANANTVLERAESSTDIETGVPNIQNLPANIKNELKKKWLELWNEETKLVSNYLSLSEEDFNAIDVDKLSPKEKAAYDRAKSRKDVSAEVLKAQKAEEARQAAEAASIPTSEENPGTVNGNTVSYDAVLTEAEQEAFTDIIFTKSNNNAPGIYIKIDGKEYANLEEDPLDVLIFDFATGEAVAITLTDLETGNKVTWSIREGENLTAAQIKETAIARSLIYTTSLQSASVIPITSTEQVEQVEETLQTEQEVLTQEFTELTEEKVNPSKDELNKYALDNIQKTKNLSDGQLRVQIEKIKVLIGDVANRIEFIIKFGESQFGDKKAAEEHYAVELKHARNLNRRLKTYLTTKINVLKSRNSADKAAVVGGENVNPQNTEIGQLTEDDINYLIQNAQSEINDLNDQLAKLNTRIENYELIQDSLSSLNTLKKLNKNVEFFQAQIKRRENFISNLNETRESQKRPEDSNIAEGPSQPTEGERPETTDLPTAEAPQTEGVSITSVNPAETAEVLNQAAQAAEVIVVTPATELPIIASEDDSTGEVMLSPEELDITIAKTTTKGTLDFNDIARQLEIINGQEVPILPDHHALASSDVTPPNMKVRFEVREDTKYWQEQRAAQNFTTEEQYNTWMMTEGWKNVPIYVMTEDGKRLPLVNAFKDGKNASRELIYKIYKSGLTPVAMAKKRFDNRDIRFKKDAEGKPVFYDLRTLFSGTEEEVMQKIRDSIVYAGMTDGKFVWKTNKLTAVKEIIGGEATVGQIGIMLKDPDGGLKIVTLSTRNLSDVQSAVEAAMKSLKTEGLGFVNFSKIVGTNEIELLNEQAITEGIEDEDLKKQLESDKERFMMIESLNSTGVKLLTFYSKSTGKFVRVNEEELRAGLAGKTGFRMQFIEFVMTDKGVRAETVKSDTDTSNKKILVQNLEKELREIINKKKFQVDINTLKSDNSDFGFSISLNGQDEVEFESYLHYLISDNALGTPRVEGSGTSSVLATDIEVEQYNTIYFDTGLKFRQLGSEENGPLPLKESIGSMLPGKRGDATPVTTTPSAPVSGNKDFIQKEIQEAKDRIADIENNLLPKINNRLDNNLQPELSKLYEKLRNTKDTVLQKEIKNEIDRLSKQQLTKRDILELTRQKEALEGQIESAKKFIEKKTAELAAIGAATAVPVSDIEAKKADIEKRRQEDLDKYEEYLNTPATGRGLTYMPSRQQRQDARDKINAKYDAELAALGQSSATVVTKQQSSVTLPGPETKINIYAGTGENADLSNFAIRPFIVEGTGTKLDGLKFNTVEGAYQAYKLYYTPNEFEGNEALLKQLQTATGAKAKSLGRTIKSLDTKGWDQDSSGNMKGLLQDSFAQNPAAAQKLLATGNATLTHTQDKGKWGTEFPKLLMEVRNELRAQEQSGISTQAPVVTQPAATTPKVIDIVEQPAENSNADALKDTETNMNDILSDIFGIETAVETKPVVQPKVIPQEEIKSSSSIFVDINELSPEVRASLGLEEDLYNDYTKDPTAEQEAQKLAEECKFLKKP